MADRAEAAGVESPRRFAPALPKAATAPPTPIPPTAGTGAGMVEAPSLELRCFFLLLPCSPGWACPLGGALELERVFLLAIFGDKVQSKSLEIQTKGNSEGVKVPERPTPTEMAI